MGVNALGTIFGPVLQTSPRVVGALITLSSTLFPNVRLVRYVYKSECFVSSVVEGYPSFYFVLPFSLIPCCF